MAVKRILDKGVTLIEVLIAMMIIMIVGLGCVQVLQFNSKATMSVFKRIQAGQYLDQIHTHLRLSPLAKLEDRYTHFPQILTESDYTAEVNLEKPAPNGSRQATITVRWNPDPATHFLTQEVFLTQK